MRTVGEQLEADKTENFVNQTLRPLAPFDQMRLSGLFIYSESSLSEQTID
jgi:hypothetical protein